MCSLPSLPPFWKWISPKTIWLPSNLPNLPRFFTIQILHYMYVFPPFPTIVLKMNISKNDLVTIEPPKPPKIFHDNNSSLHVCVPSLPYHRFENEYLQKRSGHYRTSQTSQDFSRFKFFTTCLCSLPSLPVFWSGHTLILFWIGYKHWKIVFPKSVNLPSLPVFWTGPTSFSLWK